MRSRSVAFAVALIGTLAGATSADAASIRVDRACFADPADRRDRVALSGRGFAPNEAYRVTLDGQPLPGGTGRTDGSGVMRGTFPAPSVRAFSRTAHQRTFRLGVQQGQNRPTTSFTVSRLFASFSPGSGNPNTLRVRFSLFGFRLQGTVDPPIYVHYVAPGGRLARTVRLGNADGACGALRTARRPLFGFRARRGAWRLQFDTRPRYARGTARSSFLFYRVGVRVG